MTIPVPPLSIASEAKYLTLSINRIDQVLPALYNNGFISGKWFSIFIKQDSKHVDVTCITSNNKMLTKVRQFLADTPSARKSLAND